MDKLNVIGIKKSDANVNSSYLTNSYISQISNYEIYKTSQADIVMLGDSITYGVNWNELLQMENVVNRGISGDTTEGILNRLEFVTEIKPKICFIMCGINDIMIGQDMKKIKSNYNEILQKLSEQKIILVIQSTLNVSPKLEDYKDINKKVKELNDFLIQYSKKKDLDYIDLNQKLSTDDILNDIYTYDGVHLNGSAYKIWDQEIKTILKKYSL